MVIYNIHMKWSLCLLAVTVQSDFITEINETIIMDLAPPTFKLVDNDCA